MIQVRKFGLLRFGSKPLVASSINRTYDHISVATRKHAAAKDVTLKDVIQHMNYKFGALERKVDAGFAESNKRSKTLEVKMDQGFASVRKEMKVEKSLVNDTFKRTHSLEERTTAIEKHLLLA